MSGAAAVAQERFEGTATIGRYPGTPTALQPYLDLVARRSTLTAEQTEAAFHHIMGGDATPTQIGGFLLALRVRGETVEEITGAVRAMRSRMARVVAPDGAIDTCGTGGDMAGTLNVSTAVAFVVAGCGVPVAKHGNRAVSSRSGAADVLEALGVNVDAPPEAVEASLRERGLGFLFAPVHHPAMRSVGPSRRELGTRTIFNLLGPLSNPASTRRQLLGVYASQWQEPLALVLRALGSERAWVVHGGDGLDELTTTTRSTVVELDGGRLRHFDVGPEDIGLPRASPADLKGGDARHNAAALDALLRGAHGPYRDIVILNAAAALVIAGRAPHLGQGAKLAALSIDSGAARRALEGLLLENGRRVS